MKNIPELLKKYRSTEYHYPDVVWHDLRVKTLKPKLTMGFANITKDEFKSLLLSEWFMKPRVPEQQIDDIITNNDFNEVKLRFLDLFLGKGSFEKRFQAVLELCGVGPYIASQLLSAVDNEYVIYHEKVLEGIRDALPHLVDWGIVPNKVTNASEYIKYNEVCKSIKEIFGFKNLGEIHEFFWHGFDSNWQFTP